MDAGNPLVWADFGAVVSNDGTRYLAPWYAAIEEIEKMI